MTQAETFKILAMLSEMYPNSKYKASEGMVNMWNGSLANTDYQTAVMAMYEIVETKKYMPTLAEFKEMIGDIESMIHSPILDGRLGISPFPQFVNSKVNDFVYEHQVAELKLKAAEYKSLGAGNGNIDNYY